MVKLSLRPGPSGSVLVRPLENRESGLRQVLWDFPSNSTTRPFDFSLDLHYALTPLYHGYQSIRGGGYFSSLTTHPLSFPLSFFFVHFTLYTLHFISTHLHLHLHKSSLCIPFLFLDTDTDMIIDLASRAQLPEDVAAASLAPIAVSTFLPSLLPSLVCLAVLLTDSTSPSRACLPSCRWTLSCCKLRQSRSQATADKIVASF